MKKSLLVLAAAAATTTAFAAVESTTYAPFNGLECENVYNISRVASPDEFADSPFNLFSSKIRSAFAKDLKVYIAHSRTMTVGEGDNATSNDYAHLIVYDQVTGNLIKEVQLTVGGTPISGLLCANQVGLDDFGNAWLIGLVGSTETKPISLYHIKDLDTGETELVAQLTVPEDESEAFGRHDYYDLVGDVTGKEAGTVVITPVAGGGDCFVVGFERAQGTDTWNAHMNEGEYYAMAVGETYPEGQTTWNGAPMARIIRDEDHSGTNFYIDAFVTPPTLYNAEGAMIDSFAQNTEIAPKVNANGCIEFSIGDKNFFAYAYTDYDSGVGSQVRVAEFVGDIEIASLQSAWDIPANGLGTISDQGTRMFAICPSPVTDENGKLGCYLTIIKCYNGMATYLIHEPGFVAGVSDIVADVDNNAPVQYFNLNGVEISKDNMAPGLYITRQGGTVNKVVVK